jgi:hypothetical protein
MGWGCIGGEGLYCTVCFNRVIAIVFVVLHKREKSLWGERRENSILDYLLLQLVLASSPPSLVRFVRDIRLLVT